MDDDDYDDESSRWQFNFDLILMTISLNYTVKLIELLFFQFKSVNL